MSDKLSKSLVLYVLNPPTEYGCQDCSFYSPTQSFCTFYKPADNKVEKLASCNLWTTNHRGFNYVKGPGTQTKEATGYMESTNGFGCRRCHEFVADTKRCKKVEGEISPLACCSGWEADPIRSKISAAQFKEMANYH